MTRIWAFFCTASRLIVPALFVILPYGFLRIWSSTSRNSDVLISQWSLSPHLCFHIKKLEFRNQATRIWAVFCTTSRLIVPTFFVIVPYGFLRISSSASRNSDILILKWSLSPYLWFDLTPDDQDMSIFLYSVALDCSCLFSDTPFGFLRISSFASRNSRLKSSE